MLPRVLCHACGVISHGDPLTGYAVHFTRGNDPTSAEAALARAPSERLTHRVFLRWLDDIDSTGYQNSLSILWDGHVRPAHDPLGAAAEVPEVESGHRSACFSATRLDKLARLIKTRSLYGVGFEQRRLEAKGGRPVTYLPSRSKEAKTLARAISARRRAGVDPDDPFWKATPFIDLSRTNAWEEEWRVPGGFRFKPKHVAFVFLPEELHARARGFFEEHRRQNTGPAYLCPYLDPRWKHDRIAEVLRERA